MNNIVFIIQPKYLTGTSTTWSACTATYTNQVSACNSDTSIELNIGSININKDLAPQVDTTINIGSSVKRFRALNSVSGTTSIWNASSVVNTPSLNLGLDSNNESRLITANNSIIQDDTLIGGTY